MNTYVFTIGPGSVSEKGELLLNSIEQNCKNPEIYTFIPEDEIDDISNKFLEEIRDKTTLLEGSSPIKSHKISNKQEALRLASEKSDSEYLILLDTDTIVLDEIDIHKKKKGQIFAKTADFAGQFWGSNESSENWKKLYQKYDIEFPGNKFRSTVDGKEIPPYFNTGVVIVKNDSKFAERWLEITKEIHGEIKDNFFCDQVAFGILSNEYDLKTLNETQNFPAHYRLFIGRENQILHYHEFYNLLKPSAIRILIKLTSCSALKKSFISTLRSPLNYLQRLVYLTNQKVRGNH